MPAFFILNPHFNMDLNMELNSHLKFPLVSEFL